MRITRENIINFSVDDVLNSLLWLESNHKKSVFDARTFEIARWIYEKYGISTTYNCFYESDRGSLTGVSDRFRDEIEDSAFLLFSFHGRNAETDYGKSDYDCASADYRLTVHELKRIAGAKSISDILRIHLYRANEDVVKALGDLGVQMLLTADDDRGSYDLSIKEEQRAREGIYQRDTGVVKKYLATDIRLELFSIDQISSVYTKRDRPIVVFTHEHLLMLDETKKKLDLLFTHVLGER